MHTGIGGRGLVGWEEYLGRNRRAAFCLRVISSLHAARPRLSQAFVPASMHEDGGGCCWDLLESLASSLGSTAFPREDNIPVFGSRSVPFKTPSALFLAAKPYNRSQVLKNCRLRVDMCRLRRPQFTTRHRTHGLSWT